MTHNKIKIYYLKMIQLRKKKNKVLKKKYQKKLFVIARNQNV